MSSTMIDRGGQTSPARAINSPEEVVQATLTEFRSVRRPGVSNTKIRRKMAEALEASGKLGHLDAPSRELARHATEILLMWSLMWTIGDNGRDLAWTAKARAASEFDKALRTTNPSRSRQYLEAAGKSLDLSMKAKATADQAWALYHKLHDLFWPSGSRRVSFPLPPRYKAALADTPTTDSFRVILAYCKSQLALMRALEPDVMRSLSAHRNRAAKPSRTPKSNEQEQPELVPIASVPAIPVAVGVRNPRPDSPRDLPPLENEAGPQPDPDDPRQGNDPEDGESNGPRPGGPDARPVLILGPGSAVDGTGGGPSDPPPVSDNP